MNDGCFSSLMARHKQRLLNIASKKVKDCNTNGLIQLRSGRLEILMDQNCVLGMPESLESYKIVILGYEGLIDPTKIK